MINHFNLIKRRSPQISLGSKVKRNASSCVLSDYWRENLGQATLEDNAEIIKLKHFFSLHWERNFPLAWHLYREVRTKGHLYRSRNGLSILLKGMNECMLLQGASVQGPSLMMMVITSLSVIIVFSVRNRKYLCEDRHLFWETLKKRSSYCPLHIHCKPLNATGFY